VPRPLGRLQLLLRAMQAPAETHTLQTPAGAPTGVHTGEPAGAPPAPPAPPAPTPAGSEAASDDEQDAALALRFGFHI
jgi:hypothetical protein